MKYWFEFHSLRTDANRDTIVQIFESEEGVQPAQVAVTMERILTECPGEQELLIQEFFRVTMQSQNRKCLQIIHLPQIPESAIHQGRDVIVL